MNRELHTRANLFMGLALALTCTALLLLSFLWEPGRFASARIYRVRLPDVSGLRAGNAIRLRGMQAGTVRTMGVEDGQALLTLAIRPDLAPHRDATIRLRDKSPLGGRFLELDPGSPESPPLPEGALLDSDPAPVRPEELAGFIGRLTPAFAGPFDQAQKLMSTLDALSPLADKLAGIQKEAERFAPHAHHLGPWVRQSAELGRRVSRIVTRIEAVDTERLTRVMARLDEIRGSLAETPASLPARQRLEALTESLARFASSAGLCAERQARLLDRLEAVLDRLLTYDELLIRQVIQEEGMGAGISGPAKAKRRIEQLEREAR